MHWLEVEIEFWNLLFVKQLNLCISFKNFLQNCAHTKTKLG